MFLSIQSVVQRGGSRWANINDLGAPHPMGKGMARGGLDGDPQDTAPSTGSDGKDGPS
jgi:hypothetical protein